MHRNKVKQFKYTKRNGFYLLPFFYFIGFFAKAFGLASFFRLIFICKQNTWYILGGYYNKQILLNFDFKGISNILDNQFKPFAI